MLVNTSRYFSTCTFRSRLISRPKGSLRRLHVHAVNPRSKIRANSNKVGDGIPDISSVGQSAGRIAPLLLLAGAIQGPLLDGIHGTVHLLEYKVARVDIGGLHSSLWVPALLGTYYAVLGLLTVGCDALAVQQETPPSRLAALEPLRRFLSTSGNAQATQRRLDRQAWPELALNTGVLALLLYLSAVLFRGEVGYGVIGLSLAGLGIGNWRLFDGTRQGLLLGVLCAVAAPASELVIINWLGLWEYTRPDVFGSGGLPSWVPCCYFFYTPAVSNLARLLYLPQSKEGN